MSNKMRSGMLIIISAPSGAGKTTLCRAALKELKNIVQSVSYTTRSLRENEKDGVDYHFIDEKKFKKMIRDNRFAEWAVVHGHYYGTDLEFIESKIKKGMDVILNIDIQGASALQKKYPDSISIFIHTPSFEELKKRLVLRQSESKESLEQRLRDAQEELDASSSYQYHLVNDEFSRALAELISIIMRSRSSS